MLVLTAIRNFFYDCTAILLKYPMLTRAIVLVLKENKKNSIPHRLKTATQSLQLRIIRINTARGILFDLEI